MAALTACLGRVQQEEHSRLVEALDSDRYRRLLSAWKTFLERPAPSEPQACNAGRRLAEVVSRRAWRLSRRIDRSARTLDEHAAAARLHEVRINAKKLRYLVDVAPTFCDATDLDRILAALKKLQRVLGDFNDAQVQQERLLDCGRALVASGGPPGALLAVWRLAEQSRQRRERLRGEVADGLSGFNAPDIRSACRRAFKDAGAAERAR